MTFLRRSILRLAAAASVAAVTIAIPAVAHADNSMRIVVDWGRLVEKGSDWLRSNSEKSPSQSEMQRDAEASRIAAAASPTGNAWFGASPHVSLVARDWSGARPLAGGRLSLTDQVRLSRSSRMVVTRIRLGEGRFVPFGQVGLGQWRVDTDVMNALMRDTEIASQFGGGFELQIAKTCSLAVETDYTVLYREQHEPQNISTPRFFGGFAALRLEF